MATQQRPTNPTDEDPSIATTIERAPAPAASTPRPENAAPELTGGKRKLIITAVVALLALAGITWGVRTWLYARAHESTDDAQVDGHIIPVLAKVGGYVTSVLVQDNQHVTEHQLLVTIDSAEYAVKLAQAEADLTAARTAVGGRGTTGQAQAEVASASGQREAVTAQILSARAVAERAHADLERGRTLVERQIISAQQLDALQAATSSADANLVAAQRQAAAAGATVSSAQAGVRLAAARLLAAQAVRDNAALQLGYTRIEAPTNGIVSKKLVEVGQLVQAGQTLMSVVSDTGVWITANFKETQLDDMRVGQPVKLDVDAYGGAEVEGTVESLSPATGARFALLPPDNATGNFTKVVQRVPVRVRITKALGADRPLRPGMSVNVHVQVK